MRNEWHIRTVMALYTKDCTIVRKVLNFFEVNVGLYWVHCSEARSDTLQVAVC